MDELGDDDADEKKEEVEEGFAERDEKLDEAWNVMKDDSKGTDEVMAAFEQVLRSAIAHDGKYQQPSKRKSRAKVVPQNIWAGQELDCDTIEQNFKRGDENFALGACGVVCTMLLEGRAHEMDISRLIDIVTSAWLRSRRVYSQYLSHPELMKQEDLDITDTMWLTYAMLAVAQLVDINPDSLPVARGYSYLAGELLRASIDERAFASVFVAETPRPEPFELIRACMVAATTESKNASTEDDKTTFVLPETLATRGVLRLCESFSGINKITYERFCKLANRFTFAIVRGTMFVERNLAFSVNVEALNTKVKRLAEPFATPSVAMIIETAANDVNGLAIELCCPYMAQEDERIRMTEGATTNITTVFSQSLGVRIANAIRGHAKTPGADVLKDPANPYHDAWQMIIFDRVVASASGEHIFPGCVLLESTWHTDYERLHKQNNGAVPRVPMILRILQKWYLFVTARADKLFEVPILTERRREQGADRSVALIECDGIETCLRTFYYLTKTVFDGKLHATASIERLYELFDVDSEDEE